MFTGLACAVFWPAAIAVYGAAPPVGITYAAMTLAGLGTGLFGVLWETALAQRIPPHLLSRVSSFDWMGSLALLPLGYLAAGPVADAIGATRTLVGGGVIGSIGLALALLPRSTRELMRLEPTPNSTSAAEAVVPGPRDVVELSARGAGG
jgi:hypothetical protein